MARRALTPVCLKLVQALERVVPQAMTGMNADRCLIGLSGGADSLALTAAAAWARDHRDGPLSGVELSAMVVDHGLQPDSLSVAQHAVEQANERGVAAELKQVSVNANGCGVEAGAREARYAALMHDPQALILLGHTLDDQAETVLLGMARGSGTRSLSGMPAQRDNILRPFLGVRRCDTEQACRDWGLTWWEDPTNSDPGFTRSRLRSAMGALETTLGPGFAPALARTADMCRMDADLLDSLTELEGVDVTAEAIAVKSLSAVPATLRHRVIHRWLQTVGADQVTRDHVLASDALITDWHGQKGIHVPGGTVTREAGLLRLLAR
ncbi:MAG: tRNA lysidine(34) synthetase TilS [Propionibacteriaceae bacterium]|nr:tRNA lysidine(34) synthetase TilS [Propionibacteriaceae bacterium]